MSRIRIRYSQTGEIDILLIPLILVVVLFLGAAGFAFWAFSGRQDYKNNVDEKISSAVDLARKEEDIKKDQAFAEAEKLPLTSYDGPEAYGSVHVEYPKTWSIYVNSKVNNPTPFEAYLNPKVVPSISDDTSVFALRIKVLPTSYSAVIKAFDNELKKGTITSSPYALPKVPEQVGVRIDGQINQQKKDLKGSMVVFPMRDKTLEIWTENAQLMNDYNTIILPNLKFVP